MSNMMHKLWCLVWVAVAATFWSGSARAEPASWSPDQVQGVVVELLAATGSDASLQATPLAAAETRAIVARHLHARFLKKAIGAEGLGTRFTLSGQAYEAGVTVLILSYRDELTATKRQQQAEAFGPYFKGAKVLTRFRSVAVGRQWLVLFTENDRNPQVVELLAVLAARLSDPFQQGRHAH